MEAFLYSSPIGILKIIAKEKHILQIQFTDEDNITSEQIPSAFIKECITQHDAYFNGNQKQFDVPLSPRGTEFQTRVWNELVKIPYGEMISYSELAKRLGDKNLVRAVGLANGKNPIPVIILCHRFIGKNNKLIGYGGGLWRKKWLLGHELSHSHSKLRLF